MQRFFKAYGIWVALLCLMANSGCLMANLTLGSYYLIPLNIAGGGASIVIYVCWRIVREV